MQIITMVLLLIVGLALLTKGADVFVDGASGLATKFGIPPLVVGLTIVALGTSAPEAAISIVSSIQEADAITIANVFGSNIVNVMVVLGLTSLIAEVPVQKSTLRVEIPFVFATTALLLMLCLNGGRLGRIDSLILLVFLVAYLVYLVLSVRTGDKDKDSEMAELVAGDLGDSSRSTRRLVLLSLVGAVAICIGARLTVDGATQLAKVLGMTERVIGLTVVAMGTSLPELVTSVTAARKGQTDIAFGNVIGSSILNILFVLGVAGVISPVPFATELLFDGVVSIIAVVLVWLVCIRNKMLSRVGGVALLVTYAVYLGYILMT